MAEEFAAAPRVVKPKRKYKQIEEQQQDQIKFIYNNLMWDKRIFRGNTYATLINTKSVEPSAPAQKKRIIPQPHYEPLEETSNKRANIQIYTDQFVESLTDKPPKYDYGSQTDPLQPKPVTRHQMPQKIGFDIQTQIWDNELFDFDYEVEPLLNVLCGRTLEISRMEVLQEEEMRVMENKQREITLEQEEEDRKIEAMYTEEEKKEKENYNRVKAYQNAKDKRVITHKKLFSRIIAKKYLSYLKSNSMLNLDANGLFRNPTHDLLVDKMLPQFYSRSNVLNKMNQQFLDQAVKLVNTVTQDIIHQHRLAKEVEKTRRACIIQKRAELAREKLARKEMRAEELWMKKFLEEERIELEREQERRASEDNNEGQEAKQPSEEAET